MGTSHTRNQLPGRLYAGLRGQSIFLDLARSSREIARYDRSPSVIRTPTFAVAAPCGLADVDMFRGGDTLIAPPVVNVPERLTVRHWTIVLLLFGGQMFCYMDRVNVAVALPFLMKSLHVAPAAIGGALAVFNLAYSLTVIGSGPITDRIGAKLANVFGGAFWTLATFAVAVVSSLGGFVVTRILLGVGEGPMNIASVQVISHELPSTRKATGMGVYYSGSKVGLAVGTPLAAFALHLWGWQAVFVLTGLISFGWLMAWMFVYRPKARGIPQIRNSPTKHRVTASSYRLLLTSRTVWGLVLGQLGFVYMFTFFQTWLPTYLYTSRHMSILKTGSVGFLAFLVSLVATLGSGWVADRLTQRGVSRTLVRKSLVVGGLLVAAVFGWLLALSTSNAAAVVFLMIIGLAIGAASTLMSTLTVDVAPPEIVATLASLQIGVGGGLAAISQSLVTGILFQTTHSFVLPVLLASMLSLIGAASVAFIVGKAEPLPAH